MVVNGLPTGIESTGNSLPRFDAVGKVTGQVQFGRDLARDGMLHMQLCYAHRPHAWILGINTRAARSAKGVVSVLSAQDIPHNLHGLIESDRPVLCDEKVRFEGDVIAAVVALDLASARRAVSLIEVTYEDLPVLDCIEASIKTDAPQLHPSHPGNLLKQLQLNKGNAEASELKAHVVVENTFRTPMQEHAFLEPESGLAYIDEHGIITVLAGGQNPHDDQRQIAACLSLPLEKVRVVYPAIGGAFGGREDISVQILIALAAWKLGRPVKIDWTRAESIRGHPKRHAMTIYHRWGAMQDGRVISARIELLVDAGAYACTSSSVLEGFLAQCAGAYEIPNISMRASAIYTNNIPGGAFRGYGSPQATLAAELQMEHLAERLGLDPVTVRLRNCLRPGGVLPTGNRLENISDLPAMLEVCAQQAQIYQGSPRPTAPKKRVSDPIRKGMGIAIGMKNVGFGYGFPESSSARVSLFGEAEIERVEVCSAAADTGQGSHSVLRQIASATLGLPLDIISYIPGDTLDSANAGPASASRLTSFAGNAVRAAAEIAMEKWRLEDRPAIGVSLWQPPATTSPDPLTGACLDNVSYAFAAQAVEVDVDIETGLVRVLRVWTVNDPGRAINPQQVQGQIEGAIVHAVGWTLIEDFQSEGGRIRSDRFSTYLIPTILDVPDSIEITILEQPDPVGVFGAKGVGEIPFVPIAPAIVSAVHDALGIWFDAIPLTPEVVIRGIQRSSGEAPG